MKLVALELSSRQGSVALWQDGAVLAAETWAEPRGAGTLVFELLPRAMAAAGWAWREVDAYGVSRGPGTYSGLRTALTVAQALALPDQKPVHAVNSGEVLAWGVARDHAAPTVAVVGDARRGQAWWAVFAHRGAQWVAVSDYALTAWPDLDAALPRDALRASAEWTRMAALLPPAAPVAGQWIARDVFPSAADVAARVADRMAAGVPSEPLVPLYLHAAVMGPGIAPAPQHV